VLRLAWRSRPISDALQHMLRKWRFAAAPDRRVGGRTWKTNGPALHVNAANAPLVVLDVGAANARFTVVAADLPGYGDSFRPRPTEDHAAHSKRALAEDLVAAMREVGHEACAVAGHDRGGRVGYRMALDSPAAVTRPAVLDIAPTGEI
jgi:pimeloyl-ACP methyl ester carboxylesterase